MASRPGDSPPAEEVRQEAPALPATAEVWSWGWRTRSSAAQRGRRSRRRSAQRQVDGLSGPPARDPSPAEPRARQRATAHRPATRVSPGWPPPRPLPTARCQKPSDREARRTVPAEPTTPNLARNPGVSRRAPAAAAGGSGGRPAIPARDEGPRRGSPGRVSRSSREAQAGPFERLAQAPAASVGQRRRCAGSGPKIPRRT
jgi:hypothetical protein